MDHYRLRQRILEAAKFYGRKTPSSVNDLMRNPYIQPLSIPRETIIDEADNLVAHEYLKNCRPGREPLYIITAKGIDQIDLETDKDEFVWGEMASKFQR